MKSMGDDKFVSEEKAIKKQPIASTPAKPTEQASPAEETSSEKPAKKFEGKGLAGVVKKLSEEKLEDKAKRITEKLEKNPDKKDKVVEKEKKPAAKKSSKEDKPAAKKTTKK
jgi:hypothetical protein